MQKQSLFCFCRKKYGFVFDYYSHFPEIALLEINQMFSCIMHIKSIFSRHNIPDKIMSYNRPHFSGHEFWLYSMKYRFRHVTSGLHCSQSNGLMENDVKIIQYLLKKTAESRSDPYLALLNYRMAPMKHGLLPADILFNRKKKTRMPMLLETDVRVTGDLQK